LTKSISCAIITIVIANTKKVKKMSERTLSETQHSDSKYFDKSPDGKLSPEAGTSGNSEDGGVMHGPGREEYEAIVREKKQKIEAAAGAVALDGAIELLPDTE
jgi:hypothetical protein